MPGPDENDYDAFAAAYSGDDEHNVWNALYERPASLAMVGDVVGRRVLDAGCGAGAHAAALVERGAVVTGLDSSRGLLALAGERLGPSVRLVPGDLREPLPFEASSFDVVLAALVLHHIPDWGPTLAEFHRVPTPGGRLVVSTHHPFMDHALAGGRDYFATYDFTDEWRRGGRTMRMRFWHRPLSAMTRALREAGLVVETIEEPQPDPAVRDLDPRAWESLTTSPRFLFLSATR
ncbi:methyltransferase domain-containing protein [Geodermatophilus sp. DSM 44513]|uniref:class I SAM-dependent methyltransferase n=1 Tax=Geodermatophilus sp. DSM 44513 TaxID=1528104 RepID=UPI001AA104D5|nr:methyltransferase domain-containing protein [Geodermatophilus sp. DSM 44513]WNV76526.1 class I SAM-dependent methyltransferase [Geodermatophilus sp. DSM 44513]